MAKTKKKSPRCSAVTIKNDQGKLAKFQISADGELYDERWQKVKNLALKRKILALVAEMAKANKAHEPKEG